MGKAVPDAINDLLLAGIATGDRICVCSAEPTTATEAITTYALAVATVTAGDGNGDFTIANGDTSGRKVTMTQQADVSIDADGDATHVAVAKNSENLKHVTTCTTQTLTSGGTVTIPAYKHEVLDPT